MAKFYTIANFLFVMLLVPPMMWVPAQQMNVMAGSEVKMVKKNIANKKL